MQHKEMVTTRLSLKIQYRLVDHIFVHTDKMKLELLDKFGIMEGTVSVIPFGIDNSVPDTRLTPADAKRGVGLPVQKRRFSFLGVSVLTKGSNTS
jgi:hypothetical protein